MRADYCSAGKAKSNEETRGLCVVRVYLLFQTGQAFLESFCAENLNNKRPGLLPEKPQNKVLTLTELRLVVVHTKGVAQQWILRCILLVKRLFRVLKKSVSQKFGSASSFSSNFLFVQFSGVKKPHC